MDQKTIFRLFIYNNVVLTVIAACLIFLSVTALQVQRGGHIKVVDYSDRPEPCGSRSDPCLVDLISNLPEPCGSIDEPCFVMERYPR